MLNKLSSFKLIRNQSFERFLGRTASLASLAEARYAFADKRPWYVFTVWKSEIQFNISKFYGKQLNKLSSSLYVFTIEYVYFVSRWFDVLLPKVKPYLYENGGPIIMIQVKLSVIFSSKWMLKYISRSIGLLRILESLLTF
jgi:hypothetical protein